MAKKIEASPYPVEQAERLVKIMGQSCATALALKEMKRRNESGEQVGLFIARGFIFVGPVQSI